MCIRDRVHHLFFTLAPDDKYIKYTMDKAMYLVDETGLAQMCIRDRWQTVYKDGHIVTAFFASLHRYLVGNLKLILTPLLAVEELHPNALARCV